jgi:Mn2+/Fe2+ NRAMP family transporter
MQRLARFITGTAALRWGPLARVGALLAVLGPGFITGIVDDDPTGITGYSLAGARFGYGLLWALIISTVGLGLVQEMVARMGAVTGKGLADLIREQFGIKLTVFAMATLLVANGTTTIAEFAGVAGASELFGISRYISVPIAAVGIFLIVALWSYRKVELVLLAGTTVFGAYFITGFISGPSWTSVAKGSFIPSVTPSIEYLTILIGLIGTTITPWGMFYNQSAVVDKGVRETGVRSVQVDAWVGSIMTNVIAFFIILTTAATLYSHDLPSSNVSEIAQSLGPLAGNFAARLFAIALFDSASMAMAVLPLSTVYAVCEAFGWERSVNRGIREAPIFFALLAAILTLGAVAVLIPGVPLLVLLFLPNLVDGMLLPIIVVLALVLVNNPDIMGRRTNSRYQNIGLWVTAIVLIVLTAIYLPLVILTTLGLV